jgi:flagellar export protein FliJ
MSLSPVLHWPILVEKARKQADHTRQDLLAAQSRLASLHASLSKIRALIAEYQNQDHASDGQSRSMRERLNTRAFIGQLQLAFSKLETEEQKMDTMVKQVRTRLQRDEQEVLKMEKLTENALRAVRVENDRREQKSYDELALLRRHWTSDMESD